MKNLLIFFMLTCCWRQAHAQQDAILGRWVTDAGNCVVDVFRVSDEYRAKVVWFRVGDKKPMEQWVDEHNPDKSLRSRKLIGMDVCYGLHYNTRSNEWSGGQIYDATTGKKWDSVAWLTKDGELKVKGYWVFRWISQTKTFKRLK